MQDLDERVLKNERVLTFIEKLGDKLEDQFARMEPKKKLAKREAELQEIENICEGFNDQLREMEEFLEQDVRLIASG